MTSERPSDRDKPQERERRLVLRVLNRWQELRGAREFAAWRDLGPSVLANDWANSLGLRVDNADDPAFIYVGDALREGWGREASGREGSANPRHVSDCPKDQLLWLAVQFFPQVLEKRIPISVGGTGLHNGRPILYRAILLPLSDDGSRIDRLLGAANSRLVGASSG